MEYPSLDKSKAGAFRFNTDSSQLEIYDGNQWTGVLATSPNQQTGGTRGLQGGGEAPADRDEIFYINIDTTGNALDFGNLTSSRRYCMGSSSRTRGLFMGGFDNPTQVNTVDYVTISSTGDAINYGDLTTASHYGTGGGNSTRGLRIGGDLQSPAGQTDVIDYTTFSTIGNFIDFGDLSSASEGTGGICASPTRSCRMGSIISPAANNTIEFVTTSTLGNSSDFGDLLALTAYGGQCANAVRGLCGGGAPSVVTIEYITIATLGNATEFGDLTQGRYYMSACASPTRGVWLAGWTPTRVNTMDYVQIMSTGNAIDFGDATIEANATTSGISNGHGGL